MLYEDYRKSKKVVTIQYTIKSLLYTALIVVLNFIFFSQEMMRFDLLFGLTNFKFFVSIISGVILVLIGVILRIWATFYFYHEGLKVLSLTPQNKLLTAGPYSFSRNPLILGIVCISFGLSLFIGSISSLFLSTAIFTAWDLWIRKQEEKQLEQKFGENFLKYKFKVPRWLKI
ncbi:isoprenylcysteine carboxylmethyltransferase family protein [Candidatus Roizmanbacteria bacterium]|nr:isoprenylcysteine carboxylmethyltransferase family protein [Candidatus Roizmanbacteria bacterium]